MFPLTLANQQLTLVFFRDFNSAHHNGSCRSVLYECVTAEFVHLPSRKITTATGAFTQQRKNVMSQFGRCIHVVFFLENSAHDLLKANHILIRSFRFSEHYQNVKKFHENLKQKLHEYAAQRGETFVPSAARDESVSQDATKSILFVNLRLVQREFSHQNSGSYVATCTLGIVNGSNGLLSGVLTLDGLKPTGFSLGVRKKELLAVFFNTSGDAHNQPV